MFEMVVRCLDTTGALHPCPHDDDDADDDGLRTLHTYCSFSLFVANRRK